MRRREYVDSLRLRLVLFGPAAIAAALISIALAPGNRKLAAAGAVVTTINGLTSIWYFVGISQAYTYLFFETVPRIVGAVIGIVLMRSGFSVYSGLGSMAAGMLLGLVLVTAKICSSTTGEDADPQSRRSLCILLAIQRDSLISTVAAAAYNAIPLSLVSMFNPASQPVFALADKLFKQVYSAMTPAFTVVQGWVPRAPSGPARHKRARVAIAASCGLGLASAIGIVLVGGRLLNWMGSGQIIVPFSVNLLVAAWLALSVVDAVLANTVLAALNMVKAAVRATYIGAFVGLPLVAMGARYFGVEGALVGVVTGLAVRILMELLALRGSERGVVGVAGKRSF